MTREDIAAVVYDWIRWDAPVGLKMQMSAKLSNQLIDRISKALNELNQEKSQ